MKTITQIHEQYLKKETNVSGLVSQYLDRIKKIDGSLNSFLIICGEEALAKAKQMDGEVSEEVLKSKPLFGVPVGLKDIYMTEGVRTTAASKVLENYIPQYSSTAWKKLEDAGAILVGKLNCDAWAHGSSGENSDFGSTKNPWNIEYVSGGSSSGSGAAVAADLVPFSMGTDTGGSIRLPASFCNVVGLKPTYGRVSRYGVMSMASSLDTMGHLTHTVEDCARVLSVTAGQDKYDASSNPAPVVEYHKNLNLPDRKIVIGLPEEYFGDGLDQEVAKVLEGVKEVLQKDLKFELKSISLPNTEYGIAVYYIVMTSEVSSNLGRYDGIRYGNRRNSFGDEAKRRIMLGTYVLSAGHQDAYYKKAQALRTLIKEDFDKAYENVDVLLAPVSPTLPFKIGEKSSDPMAMYLSDVLTVNINLSGVPGLAIPGGFSSSGLPIGFQLIGPHFSEQLLFQVGHAYQQKTDWHLKSPTINI